jgi:hypothetical protein
MYMAKLYLEEERLVQSSPFLPNSLLKFILFKHREGLPSASFGVLC